MARMETFQHVSQALTRLNLHGLGADANAVSLDVCRSLAKRACALLPHTKIFNFYGPTEATIGVSHWLANGGKYEGVSTLPIGPPMANTHLYILDADLRPVAVGSNTHLPLFTFLFHCWSHTGL